ncbi:MAG TPA: DUF5686 family protein [Sunxiuqinia sp.]|nr:DUF5686 family protein [Sunxiuqinia sp.]
MRIYIAIFLFLIAFRVMGEPITVRVLSAKTERPLAFVNVVFDHHYLGTSSNIDGYFSLNSDEVDTIILSYVGYEELEIPVTAVIDNDQLKLIPKPESLLAEPSASQVNAAESIIQRVVENKRSHQLDNLNSYQYQRYNKLTFSLTDDTKQRFLQSVEQGTDSGVIRLDKLASMQYLFLMETVSKKLYENPNRRKEVILANRVTGLQRPSFLLLATQLQSFSFYKTYIQLFKQEFLSPISYNSWNKYEFVLENQFPTVQGDTLFVIRFHPRPYKNFNGLAGVLQISSDGYAIQSVRAQAARDQEGKMQLDIEKLYTKLPTGQWFPYAMNADLLFSGLTIPGSNMPPNSVVVHALGKTYFSRRQVNIWIDDKQFDGPRLSVSPQAANQPAKQWDHYRPVPLSGKDSLIYELVDSLGKQDSYQQNLLNIESLASWRYPIGFVDVCLDQLVGYNKFEGLKLGVCLETNPKFSKRFQVGGYWRYGLKDQEDKYGGHINYRLDSLTNTRLFASYEKDVREDGEIKFMEQQQPFISRQLDVWFKRNFTYHQQYKVGVEGWLFPNLRARLYWRNYRLLNPTFVDATLPSHPIDYNNIGIQLRLTFEELLFHDRGKVFALGSRYPVLHFNYEKSLDFISDRSYRAAEFRLDDSYKLRNLGESQIQVIGSWRNSGGVYNLLASPPFSRSKFFNIYRKNTFATMRVNEFVADKLLAVFWRHNFGSLLFRQGNFKPDVMLAFNAGIGSSSYDDWPDFSKLHPSISKGYYECGLLIPKLIKFGILKLGTGAFYRLGPYRFDTFKENLALKFTLDVGI